MSPTAAFVYDPSLSQHVLRQDHPMRPIRLQHTYDLLDAYGAFRDADVIPPRQATVAELATFHSRPYIEAVERLSRNQDLHNMASFNFSLMGDNPIYPGIFEAAALSTGASMVAAEMVAEGTVRAAFNISGGLHHAAADHASGFCVFNDPVVAINYFLSRGMKVAYVDIDAHHGDGVQDAFYDTDAVLTISTHESGQFLFPGTGFADEIGSGAGRGFAVNLPLFPYTGDDAYLWAFNEVVIPLVRAFKPDVLVIATGHRYPPSGPDNPPSANFQGVHRSGAGIRRPGTAVAGLGWRRLRPGGGGPLLDAGLWGDAVGGMGAGDSSGIRRQEQPTRTA